MFVTDVRWSERRITNVGHVYLQFPRYYVVAQRRRWWTRKRMRGFALGVFLSAVFVAGFVTGFSMG